MKFKKSLGQNLLTDKNVLNKIVSLTSFYKKDVIVHDYESNFKTLQKNYINFDRKEIFVNSFNDLNLRLKKILHKLKKNHFKKNNKFYFYKKKINYDITKELISIEKHLK